MKLKKRIAALLMAGAMVCSTLPVNVLAVENSNQNVGGLCEHHTEHNADCGYIEGIEGTPCGYVCEICKSEQTEQARTTTIVGFDELAPEVAEQTVQPGTALEDLNLPDTLRASAYMAEDDTQPITIEGVTWEPDGSYDPTAEVDGYLFAPVLPEGYVLAEGVELPEIAVMVLAADNAIVPMADVEEQFDGILAPGGRYYFDLSAMNIPGTVNDKLPAGSLRWVPFTYAGTVNAYSRKSAGVSTDNTVEPYDHSLFIADYNVTHGVSWNQLNEKQMIFGKEYQSGGVSYTLRAPSAGSSSTGSDDSMRGTPQSNEWDAILDKANQKWNDNTTGYIKNWTDIYSCGQDNATTDASHRAVRGYFSARNWRDNDATYSLPYVGFRPVLESLNADTLNADRLKVVTLDLDGGKLGNSSEDIQIIVKNNSTFTAPVSDGLTRPDGVSGNFFKWRGSNGKFYAPGDSVPADVTELTVQWAPTYTVTLNTNGGTINSGNVTSYTYGTGAALPTADNVTYTGHTFIGWYDNEGLTGSPVTAIGDTETGNKEYWAK